jgi:hypothetical protein
MIRFDPIIISDGTLRGAYSERALVKFWIYEMWNKIQYTKYNILLYIFSGLLSYMIQDTIIIIGKS